MLSMPEIPSTPRAVAAGRSSALQRTPPNMARSTCSLSRPRTVTKKSINTFASTPRGARSENVGVTVGPSKNTRISARLDANIRNNGHRVSGSPFENINATPRPVAKRVVQSFPARHVAASTPRPASSASAGGVSGKKRSIRMHKTDFPRIYSSCWPARMVHGSIRPHIEWSTPPEKLASYDPYLIACAMGIREEQHPFPFVARECFRDMCFAPGALERCSPLLDRIVQELRAALLCGSSSSSASSSLSSGSGTAAGPGIFDAALVCIQQLASVVGPALNDFLPQLLVQINKRMFVRQSRPLIQETLCVLDRCGGKEAYDLIKRKVPTYQSL